MIIQLSTQYLLHHVAVKLWNGHTLNMYNAAVRQNAKNLIDNFQQVSLTTDGGLKLVLFNNISEGIICRSLRVVNENLCWYFGVTLY